MLHHMIPESIAVSCYQRQLFRSHWLTKYTSNCCACTASTTLNQIREKRKEARDCTVGWAANLNTNKLNISHMDILPHKIKRQKKQSARKKIVIKTHAIHTKIHNNVQVMMSFMSYLLIVQHNLVSNASFVWTITLLYNLAKKTPYIIQVYWNVLMGQTPHQHAALRVGGP